MNSDSFELLSLLKDVLLNFLYLLFMIRAGTTELTLSYASPFSQKSPWLAKFLILSIACRKFLQGTARYVAEFSADS